MNHKLLVFVYSTDNVMSVYAENQVNAIKEQFPDLAVELLNENDVRLATYSRRADRFPAFLMFEHDIFKAEIHGKFDNPELFSWIINNLR